MPGTTISTGKSNITDISSQLTEKIAKSIVEHPIIKNIKVKGLGDAIYLHRDYINTIDCINLITVDRLTNENRESHSFFMITKILLDMIKHNKYNPELLKEVANKYKLKVNLKEVATVQNGIFLKVIEIEKSEKFN